MINCNIETNYFTIQLIHFSYIDTLNQFLNRDSNVQLDIKDIILIYIMQQV